MAAILRNDWADYLNEEFEKEYYINLRKFLAAEYRTKTIYPDRVATIDSYSTAILAELSTILQELRETICL